MPVTATSTYYLDGPFRPALHMLDTTETDLALIAQHAANSAGFVHTFVKPHAPFAGYPKLISNSSVSFTERFIFIACCPDASDYVHITQIDMLGTEANPS